MAMAPPTWGGIRDSSHKREPARNFLMAYIFAASSAALIPLAIESSLF
jgi:hypothetical protein